MNTPRTLWQRRLLACGVALLACACLGVFMALFLFVMAAIEKLVVDLLVCAGISENHWGKWIWGIIALLI
jgi:uncharacterized BrkB/YihY/UPF0761 family membrane protein